MFLRFLGVCLIVFILSSCEAFQAELIGVRDVSDNDIQRLSTVYPPRLSWIENNIEIVEFDIGPFCWVQPPNGLYCRDTLLPRYDYQLLVSDTMIMRIDEPFPESIYVSLYEGLGTSYMMDGTPQVSLVSAIEDNGRIEIDFPDNLQGIYVLEVHAFWENGDDVRYTLPVQLAP